MKSRSAKNKGKRLQNEVRDILLEEFKDHLEADDIKSAVMGDSGEDIQLSPAARKLIPYAIECKNQEKLNIWSALEQAEINAKEATPVVVFKRNRSKTFAVIELTAFIKLIKENKNG